MTATLAGRSDGPNLQTRGFNEQAQYLSPNGSDNNPAGIDGDPRRISNYIGRRKVIDREERYLIERFGDVYGEYQVRVRRWL